jgi:hypothetical protein
MFFVKLIRLNKPILNHIDIFYILKFTGSVEVRGSSPLFSITGNPCVARVFLIYPPYNLPSNSPYVLIFGILMLQIPIILDIRDLNLRKASKLVYLNAFCLQTKTNTKRCPTRIIIFQLLYSPLQWKFCSSC